MAPQLLDRSRCKECGQSLKGVDPIEISYGPYHSDHLLCCDWSERTWLYPYLVPAMRSLCYSLPRLLHLMRQLGPQLSRLEQQWPGRHPVKLIIEARRRRSTLKEFIRQAKIEERLRSIAD